MNTLHKFSIDESQNNLPSFGSTTFGPTVFCLQRLLDEVFQISRLAPEVGCEVVVGHLKSLIKDYAPSISNS